MNALAVQPVPTPVVSANPAKADSNWPKEYVAAALALAIVGFTLFFAYQMFLPGDKGDAELWSHRTTIFQSVLALTGSVAGYYFGRLPAERAAAMAHQNAAASAQASASNANLASQAMQNEGRIRTQVGGLLSQLQSSSPMGGAAPSADVQALRTHIGSTLSTILGN